MYWHDLWTWSGSVTIKYSESKRCTPTFWNVYNVFVCDVIQNVVCSVNTKTPHVNHQVCSVTCSVNNGKKLSIEVFTPKLCHLGHSFYELGIMPNIQSKSLETTVVVLFDLTVHSLSTDSFRRYHRQRTRWPPFPEIHRSWVITEDDWKPAQSNKTPPCTRFDRLLEHRHDLGYTLFLGNPEIPDPTDPVNTDRDGSPGRDKVKNRPVWTKDFLVESTVSGSVFSEKLPPVTIMTNLLSPWTKISDTVSIKITPTTLYNLIFYHTSCNMIAMKLPPIKVGVSEY